MILARKQLIHLPVQTASGQKIGRVQDVELDEQTHEVLHYHVIQGDIVIPGFSGTTLLVAPSQVVELTDQRMLVDDALISDPAVAPEPAE